MDESKLVGQRVEKKQRKIQLGVLKDAAEHLKSGWGWKKTSGIGGSPRKTSIKNKNRQ